MITISTALKNARLAVLSDDIDNGAATLKLYSGTIPADNEALTDQVELCELLFENPCANDITDAVLTFKPLAEQMITMTGVVTFARIIKDDGTTVIADIDVGDMASSAHLRLPNQQLYQGALLRLDSWQISEL